MNLEEYMKKIFEERTGVKKEYEKLEKEDHEKELEEIARDSDKMIEANYVGGKAWTKPICLLENGGEENE